MSRSAQTSPIRREWLQTSLLVIASIAVGLAVAKGWGLLVVAAIVFAGAFTLAPEYKIGLAFVATFFPFSIGSIGPIPNLLVSEALVPIAFPLVLMKVTQSGQRLVPREGRRFVVAIGLLLAVTFYHFLRGPMLNSVGGASLGASGLRPFYIMAVNVGLFFMAMWVLEWIPRDRASWGRFLYVLLVSSLVLAIVRVITFTLGVDTPLMSGVFDYGGRTALAGGAQALRIGGLAETAGLGMACIAALWTMRSIRPGVALPLLLVFLALAGLSGGRSFVVGAGFALFAYLLGPARGRRLVVVIAGAIAVALTVFVAVSYGYANQLARLMALQGGLQAQDPARAEIFRIQWANFLSNPLIGKGIGVVGEGLADSFIAAQVVAGGHASYISMMGNFGLVGLFFICVFALVPLWDSLMFTRRAPSDRTHTWIQGMMTFVLIQSVIRGLEYVVGGSGYQDPRMFLITAVFVVILGAARTDDVAT